MPAPRHLEERKETNHMRYVIKCECARWPVFPARWKVHPLSSCVLRVCERFLGSMTFCGGVVSSLGCSGFPLYWAIKLGASSYVVGGILGAILLLYYWVLRVFYLHIRRFHIVNLDAIAILLGGILALALVLLTTATQ
ncbi:MAG: hypothetical protein QG656_160 [Candidatus Hydrogenedentes bacterium]|nr:hypothetical protein [Candidatus Hydrogenedentota bacterium]